MTKNYAVLRVLNPSAFAWVGDKSVFQHVINKLEEVRGIDAVLCVAADGLLEQSRAEAKTSEAWEISVAPAAGNSRALTDCLPSAAPPIDAATMTYVDVLYPFLSAGAIEACLQRTRRKINRCARTVLSAAQLSGLPNKKTVDVPVDACYSVTFSSSVKTEDDYPVRLSLIEALNVSDLDHFRLASALVAHEG